jgi:glucose/arabinose dehydrogenase
LLVLVTLSALVCVVSTTTRAQLPPEVKSDLGPDVPDRIRVRPGYRVTRALAANKLPGGQDSEARFLQFSADGKTLYVSARHKGEIYALRDLDANGIYQSVTTFIKDKRSVQGMAIHDGSLYFQVPAEGSLYRARDKDNDGKADDVETILPPRTLPKPGNHPYNALLITDKEIYISASDPSNMTEDINSESKKIYVFDLDGKNKRVFCSGVRNTEELQFRPGTNEIWGFDHGSDNFGKNYGETASKDQPITDLNPPEEFNRYVEGGFYGHPYIMGNGVPRPEFSKRPDILELADKNIAPEWQVHAHWSVCGWTFLTTDYFGPGHKGDAFFASRGSWNSLHPVGSCVQRVLFDPVTGKPYGSMTIVDCGSDGDNRKSRPARPVDCVEAPDGSVIFSSDEPVGALFRISRSPGAGTSAGR